MPKTIDDYEQAQADAQTVVADRVYRRLRMVQAKQITHAALLLPRCRQCGWGLGERAQLARERGLCLHCFYGLER